MGIIVDTSVWSLAFRRDSTVVQREVELLKQLIDDAAGIFLLGIIATELLQGIRRKEMFEVLRDQLLAYPFIEPEQQDYIFAAELVNQCLARGIQIKTIDALIASVTMRREYSLLTADKDFSYIAKHFPLKLL